MFPDNCEFCGTTYNRSHSANNTFPYCHKYEYGGLFSKKEYEICDYCLKYLTDNKGFDITAQLECKSNKTKSIYFTM